LLLLSVKWEPLNIILHTSSATLNGDLIKNRLWKTVCHFLKKLNISQAQHHTCNPSYSWGRDQEFPGSRPAWAKSSRDSILTTKKLGVVTLTCHPSYSGSLSRRISGQAGLSKKWDPIHKINN
jgi:hypothetical protein